jgi:hypothetical protein
MLGDDYGKQREQYERAREITCPRCEWRGTVGEAINEKKRKPQSILDLLPKDAPLATMLGKMEEI